MLEPPPYQLENQPTNQETSQIHRKSARRAKKRPQKEKKQKNQLGWEQSSGHTAGSR